MRRSISVAAAGIWPDRACAAARAAATGGGGWPVAGGGGGFPAGAPPPLAPRRRGRGGGWGWGGGGVRVFNGASEGIRRCPRVPPLPRGGGGAPATRYAAAPT